MSQAEYTPVDIGGKPLHVGDKVESLKSGQEFVVSEIDVASQTVWLDFPGGLGHPFPAYHGMLLKIVDEKPPDMQMLDWYPHHPYGK